MRKWVGLGVGYCLFMIASSTAMAEDRDNTPCAQLQRADMLSAASCSDPALKTVALSYARICYALQAQDTAGDYKTVEKQMAENNATLQRTCSLPPTGPETAHPSGKEKACFIRVRQKQTAALSHWLKGPYIQEANRPIALHIALQQKLIDGGYLSLSSSKADGIYDDHTRDAIRDWQAAYGDDRTGVITNDEIPHLQKLGLVTFGKETASRRSDVSFISFPQPLVSSRKDPVLTRIFQMDMLEIDRGYLEKITGPAKYRGERSDGLTPLTYIVNDCEVTAYADGNTIKGYNLYVTPKCTIPLGPHSSSRHPSLSLADITFGEFNTIFHRDNKPVGLCFNSACGVHTDPSIGIISRSPHHNTDEITITVTASPDNTESDKVSTATEQWSSAMTAPDDAFEKQEYVWKGKFNCEKRYDEAGFHAMRDVAIQYFSFGRMDPDILMEINNPQDPSCEK